MEARVMPSGRNNAAERSVGRNQKEVRGGAAVVEVRALRPPAAGVVRSGPHRAPGTWVGPTTWTIWLRCVATVTVKKPPWKLFSKAVIGGWHGWLIESFVGAFHAF
jgi:hypothetical protein